MTSMRSMPITERVVRAARHGAGRLADGEHRDGRWQIRLTQNALDACATIDRAQRGVEQFEKDAPRAHDSSARPARSALDDLEAGAIAVAARRLGQVRTLGLAGARGIRA